MLIQQWLEVNTMPMTGGVLWKKETQKLETSKTTTKLRTRKDEVETVTTFYEFIKTTN